MTTCSFDFETFSEADLKKVGLSRYARHPTTEVILCSWSVDSGPTRVWSPAEGEPMPKRLRELLEDPEVIKRCWNAQFERAITQHVLKIDAPPESYRCTMALSYSLSMPGALGNCNAAIGVPDEFSKNREGKALIRLFCQPRKPTKTKPWTRATHETDPEKWARFKEYCRQDDIAQKANYNRLRRWDMSPREQNTWVLDQKINELGIPVNMRVVRNAVELVNEVMEDRTARMAKLTGLENPHSQSKLLKWCRSNGYLFEDLKRGHVEAAIASGPVMSERLLKVLEMRAEVSKTSVKKYQELLNSTDDDGNLRYCFQYAGASRTGRWGGRRFQPQNLARPAPYLEKIQEQCVRSLELLDTETLQWLFDKPMDLLSTCVRPVVQAPKGFMFVDADLNAIENRVLGWMCGEEKILDVFRNGRDPYIDFATYMFDEGYDSLFKQYKAGDKSKRQTAKPGVLGCGYQLGAGEQFEDPRTGEVTGSGLIGYALNLHISLTPEQSAHAVETWRDTYSEVVRFWRTIETAAKRCIQTGKPTEAGEWIRFEMSGPFLRAILPSNRAIHYCRPKIKMVKTKYGMKENIVYQGENDRSQWAEVKTYGGKLVENCVQAIARDLLVYGMKKAWTRGVEIRLHVHDQICGLVPEKKAEQGLKTLIECMSETPRWAEGLPLSAEGALTKYFMKD